MSDDRIENAASKNPGKIETDICIIGSGPGGSAAARTLAREGRKVVVLEWGDYRPPPTFDDDGLKATGELYADFGKKTTEGMNPVLILSGKGVGGGTLVNSAISFEAPKEAVARWADLAGFHSTTYESLLPYMIEVQKTFEVNALAIDRQGVNNQLMHKGLKKLGWHGEVIPRNAVGCAPCARCFFGCPIGAKRSTDKNFLIQAMDKGARLITGARADGVRMENGQIKSLLGKTTGEKEESFEVTAKHFVLAAGAVGSAHFLLKNRIANSSKLVGRGFHCHPTTAVVGDFDQRVDGFKSINQGYYSSEFFSEGILLESAWVPAEGMAMLVPGTGPILMERMSRFRNYAMAGGMIRDEASGSITLDGNDNVRVAYEPTENDTRRLTKILYASARIMFAAGATQVFTQSSKNPVLKSMDELESAEKAHTNLGPEILLEGNHGQGTCRMNNDSAKGVVNEHGRSHDIPNLWIMDVSTFPDALGVNPQITIAALAIRNGEYLSENF